MDKKLSNKKFISAPAKVLELERQKKTDAKSKIKSYETYEVALKGLDS